MIFQHEDFEIEVSRIKEIPQDKTYQYTFSIGDNLNTFYEIELKSTTENKTFLVKFHTFWADNEVHERYAKLKIFNVGLLVLFYESSYIMGCNLENNQSWIVKSKNWNRFKSYKINKYNITLYTEFKKDYIIDFEGNLLSDVSSEYNTNDLEAVKIHKKLDDLNYYLNDVTTIEKVREFERKHNIALPEDYVWFITNVGDGGGGLDLYPLEHIDKYDEFSYDEEIEKGDDWKMEDLTQDRITAINIMSEGCSYSTGIFIKGEHYGEISKNAEWFAYHDDRIHFKNFKEWYLAWLNEVYLGYSGSSFEYHKLGKIEDILEEYKTTKDISCIWTVRQKCKSISKEVEITLLNLFNSETIIKNKGLIGRVLEHFHFRNMDYIIENMYQSECYGDLAILLHYKNYSQFRDYSRLLKMLDYLSHNVINDKNCSVSANSGFMDCLHLIAINPEFNQQDIQEVLSYQDKDVLEAISTIKTMYNIDIRKDFSI